MSYKIGDKYWTFYTSAEIYGEVHLPFIELKELEVRHQCQLRNVEQDYFFKTKNDAIDGVIAYFESMRDKGEQP